MNKCLKPTWLHFSCSTQRIESKDTAELALSWICYANGTVLSLWVTDETASALKLILKEETELHLSALELSPKLPLRLLAQFLPERTAVLHQLLCGECILVVQAQ